MWWAFLCDCSADSVGGRALQLSRSSFLCRPVALSRAVLVRRGSASGSTASSLTDALCPLLCDLGTTQGSQYKPELGYVS